MLTDNPETQTAGLFAGRWWAVLLRGIIALAFGSLAFAWPGVTLGSLVLLFGTYALLDGVASLLSQSAAAARARKERRAR